MFYHIFDYLEQFDFPGAGMFQYITFRSACAVILSLLIATVVGKRIIRILQKQQVGEEIRDLGLEGQMHGLPTVRKVGECKKDCGQGEFSRLQSFFHFDIYGAMCHKNSVC